MDAQFVNYEDQYASIPQYAQIAENSNSKPFVDDFGNSEYLSPEQLQQESWIQRIRRRLASKRSNRKRKARKMAIAKSLENDFENSKHQSSNQPQPESWSQWFKRHFYRQKPVEVSVNMDAQKSFESSEDADSTYTESSAENSTFPQGPLPDDTETTNSSSLSTPNAINESDSLADNYSNADTYNTESSAAELYEQQPDQDSFDKSSSFELSTSRQPAPVRSPEEFEQTLNICTQQLSLRKYNVTDMTKTLINLYTQNSKYLHNYWYTQETENLLGIFVSQVAYMIRKSFNECLITRSLARDFMKNFTAIDYLCAWLTTQKSLQHISQDLVTIVNARFIDWFRLLIQTPGVNLERFFSTIHDYWGRFHSIPMKQLMIRVADLSNNDDCYSY